MKNNLIRGVRKASRLPDGAAADGRLQGGRARRTCRCELPAVVIGGGLTAIDTATELLAYYPLQVEKTLARYEALGAENGRGRPCARRSTRRSGRSSTGCSPTGAPSARSASARPPPARSPISRASCRDGAASRSPTAGRSRTRRPTGSTTKRSSRPSRRASPSSRTLEPEEAVPDEYGKLAARSGFLRRRLGRGRSSCRRGRCSSRPARRPTSPTRRSARTRFPLDQKRRFFAPHRAVPRRRRRLDARPGAGRGRRRVLHRRSRDGRFVTFFGDNHPRLRRQRRQGDGLGASNGYRAIAALFARRAAAPRRGAPTRDVGRLPRAASRTT